jgi:hypothetical protein
VVITRHVRGLTQHCKRTTHGRMKEGNILVSGILTEVQQFQTSISKLLMMCIELSSLVRTLGSWVRIPLKVMDVCVRLFCVCVVLCVGSGLATG